jgi:hypothetical protein
MGESSVEVKRKFRDMGEQIYVDADKVKQSNRAVNTDSPK